MHISKVRKAQNIFKIKLKILSSPDKDLIEFSSKLTALLDQLFNQQKRPEQSADRKRTLKNLIILACQENH